ncbi:MAG: hypothetical protein ACF8OB_04665 [Phycisphaeraceae bacterium JB051]
MLTVCILVLAAWRLFGFSTVIGVDPGHGMGVEIYDTLSKNKHLIMQHEIDQLGLILSEDQFELTSYVQHSLVPLQVWTNRVDLEHVLVIGYGTDLPSVIKSNGSWQMELTIDNDIIIYRRESRP